ncbi:RNA methyltransferase [Crocosphaera chwakensis]|uniref:tRNA (cytidine/uridine-2'-O-)-methyltransferase TrmJ n=1 Tax=Crocosphaera chwakensis CCY0110 TaxID=391612 RepID=A3IT00_9CHRO|nr:RNA methyltransferase [Crocosphaera chwakensis]EAZ90431.1 RNA methyltransferase TrmH, group 1 [Crocosphaera chwakensis CCY0110]
MNETALTRVRIVLVEPAGPLNVGSVARVMKNMSLNQLFLVKPHCDRLGEEARLMAVHGIDVLEKSQVVDTIPQALQGCHRIIATTGRSLSLPTHLETPRNALPWLLTDDLNTALIFGPEDRGLNNEELSYAQRFVCIPANSDYSSLNLAQAVAVCSYELYQVAQNPLENTSNPSFDPAAFEALEGYYQHLEAVLLKIGYLYPHTAKARLEKFRRLYNKANLTTEEVALLRGILRQVDWACQDFSSKNK